MSLSSARTSMWPTSRKKMHIFPEGQQAGSSVGEQARYALGELPCGSFIKGAIRSYLNWAILLCDVIPDWKNLVNCAVLTGNSAGLRTVLPSRLSHRELRSSLRESHIFLSLLAETMTALSQGTHFIQQMNIAWYIPFQIPLLTPLFTLSFFFG